MATVTRVLGSVFGVLFLFISVPMMLGGITLLALPATIADDQGYMNTSTFHLESDNSYAFVSESFSFNVSKDMSSNRDNHDYNMTVQFDNYGKIINVRIISDSYFLGLASTSDVKNYLSNVPYEVVNQLENNQFSTYSVNSDKNGSQLSYPSEQSFWIASGVGTLYYTPSSADFDKDLSLVIMKSDGSQGVNTDVKIGVSLPILQPIGIGLLVFGSIFFILTIALFVVAYKSKDNKRHYKYYTVPTPPQVLKTQPEQFYTNPDATSVKFCVNCGHQIDLDARYCESCGYANK